MNQSSRNPNTVTNTKSLMYSFINTIFTKVKVIMIFFLLHHQKRLVSSLVPSFFGRTTATRIRHFNNLHSPLSLLSSNHEKKTHVQLRFVSIQNEKYPTTLFMETDDDDNNNSATATIEKQTWNIPELKKETSRLTLRCHKKIGKASSRLTQANEQVEELRTNPNPTLEELESCPNVTLYEQELQDLQERLRLLNLLEEKLQNIKKGGTCSELPEDVLALVLELDVNDEGPQRQERPKVKKQKGPKTVAPRLPYFRYYTENETEIRVSAREKLVAISHNVFGTKILQN